MGLNIFLVARKAKGILPSPKEVAKWISSNYGEMVERFWSGEDEQGLPLLTAQLHPAAESLMFTWLGLAINFAAKTSGAGPGYHHFLSEFLDDFAANFKLVWDAPDEQQGTGDESGYFFSRDIESLHTAFEDWLANLSARILEVLAEHYKRPVHLSMPEGALFQVESAVVTPMGPRDDAWLQRAANEPEAAFDLFPWNDQEMGAAYWLGRALCLMWSEVRWRNPYVDKETELLKKVVDALKRAWELNPNLSYPFSEWHEINTLLEDESALAKQIAQRARSHKGPLVGYRRGDVEIEALRGWSVCIPGSFLVRDEDDGGICAYADSREVWVSSLSVVKKDGKPPSATELLRDEKKPAPQMRFNENGVQGIANIVQKTGEEGTYFQLEGRVAVLGNLAITTILFPSEEHRSWAEAVWKSLRHQALL